MTNPHTPDLTIALTSAVLVTTLLSGCGIPYVPTLEYQNQIQPTVISNKALVYVYRVSEPMGSAEVRHVIFDGEEVGSYSDGQYCYFYAPPGEHVITLELAFVVGHIYPTKVNFDGGKVYYFDEANRFLPGMQLVRVNQDTASYDLRYLQLNNPRL